MKETAHYKLNQWELSDLIRMQDFNADNTKLDAALAALSARVDAAGDSSALDAKLGRTEIIWSRNSGDQYDWYSMPPEIESWDDWDLYGILYLPGLSQCGGTDRVHFDVLKATGGTRLETELPLGPFLALLFPWHGGDRAIRGLMIGAGTAVLQANFAFKDIGSLGLGLTSSQGHMISGDEITVFGLR